MKRRAHIEFLSVDRIKVTTLFENKIIELSEEYKYVDLINLKLSKFESDFFAYCGLGSGTIEEPYILEIYAKKRSDGWMIPVEGLENGYEWVSTLDSRIKQTFEVNIVE